MIPNNNLNVLPFYSSIDEQDSKKEYAYGEIFPLIAGNARILPFQINREHSAGTSVNKAILHNHNTGGTTNILTAMNNAGLTIKEFSTEGYDLIINPSVLIFPTLVIQAGQYYLEIGDANNTWYSEIFTVVEDLSQYLKIEYWDAEHLQYTKGHIDYTAPYKNYCYVKTEIGKPEYPFEEQAQKRDGYIFIEKQVSEKKYKFEFLAPEYLCDALRIVRMHDYINLYFKGKTYKIENIIFEPKWKEQGNLAVVEVEFECDTILKKTGRGIVQTGGGFNNDYNDDYNN